MLTLKRLGWLINYASWFGVIIMAWGMFGLFCMSIFLLLMEAIGVFPLTFEGIRNEWLTGIMSGFWVGNGGYWFCHWTGMFKMSNNMPPFPKSDPNKSKPIPDNILEFKRNA